MPTERVAVDLDSSDPAVARLERHSYVNLINVVHAELQLVERMVDRPGSLRSAIYLAEAASRAFKESRVARRHLNELARFADLIESDLSEALAEAGPAAEADDVREALAILREVLPDAHLRVQEVIARHGIPHPSQPRDAHSLDAEPADGAQEILVPVGLERALGALTGTDGAVAEIGSVGIGSVGIEEREALHLTVDGSVDPTYFRPAWSNLRPSELHATLDSHGEPLRSVILLSYLASPGGSVTMTLEDAAPADGEAGGQRVGFALAAVIPVRSCSDEPHPA